MKFKESIIDSYQKVNNKLPIIVGGTGLYFRILLEDFALPRVEADLKLREELEKLSKKYELILLTDNWPSTTRTLKNAGIHDYFKKVYISSEYGSVKADGVFFDYPIEDFGIKKDEAIFVDDAEVNLDVAKEKGFVVRGPRYMPNKNLSVTVRKSPCGEGTNTWDAFKMKIHTRIVDIKCSPTNVSEITKFKIKPGVDINIKIWKD